jgi:PAS domain S-box-containing protein
MQRQNQPFIPIREQFKMMANAAPVMMSISGPDKLCYFFNVAWLAFTGRTMEMEHGNGWMEGIHPDDLEQSLNSYIAHFDARKNFKIEYRLKRYDGQYRWLAATGAPLHTNDGNFAGYITNFIDIDELLETAHIKNGFIGALALEKEQALNEELATINEELSAANEELQQSQESLHAINEELEKRVQARIAELSESEQRFILMAENSDILIAVGDESGNAVYFSKAWVNLTGRSMKKLLAFGWVDLVHPDDRDRYANIYLDALKKREPFTGEFRILSKKGDYRWLLANGPPRFRPNGSFAGYISSCVDITERKQFEQDMHAMNEELTAGNEELAATNEELAATNEELAATNEELYSTQEELQRSEKLFRSIALNIPKSLIIVIDKDHRYVIVEGDIMEKMGYDRRDYEGKHPKEISAERYEVSRHLYERVIAGEQFSVERKAPTGEDYIVHFVPLKNEQGKVDTGLIIALDITDIKQAEEKSAKLAAIIESSDDAIISKTLESVITSWNDSAERMFGYTADEIIGETIYKLIPPDRQEEEPRILARLKSGERVEHFETKRMTRDGKLLDVSLTISPVKDKRGNIIGLSKIIRDITEKKLDETRKNDFIGMVSHELKTPLTSLNALIQVTSAKLKNNDDVFLTGAMEKANTQVKRMSSMINGFLNVSRLESGKLLIDKQNFELNQLISETINEIKLTSPDYSITFNPANPILLHADKDKISSVISNLLSNAVKYSPKEKLIKVDCEIIGKELRVSVKDEGMGINSLDIEKIFDRYYRVETTHTQHISGFGIGLYLSAEIIERHNGRIWVESKPGKGSTFYFILPMI